MIDHPDVRISCIHKVIVQTRTRADIVEIIKWCHINVGNHIRSKSGNAMWYFIPISDTRSEFYFKNYEKSIEFKLVWK